MLLLGKKINFGVGKLKHLAAGHHHSTPQSVLFLHVNHCYNFSAINPCQKRVCHEHAVCVHTGPNQHTCTCAQGYQGDGLVCLAIDPCQTNYAGCPSNSSRCVYDEPGKVFSWLFHYLSSLNDVSCTCVFIVCVVFLFCFLNLGSLWMSTRVWEVSHGSGLQSERCV